jgi:hypothetical protein
MHPWIERLMWRPEPPVLEPPKESWDVRAAARIIAQDAEISALQKEVHELHVSLSRIHDLAQGTDHAILEEVRKALRLK